MIGISTNIKSWSDKTASLSTQVLPLPWLGIFIGATYKPQQANTGRFLTESQSFEIQGETRFYLFGPPAKIFEKDRRPAYWKKPKSGCRQSWCAGVTPKRGPGKILAGFYIAPGYSYHKQEAVFIPDADVNSPVPEFRYIIQNQGPTVSGGYELRFRRLSLGIGAGLKFSQPKWKGPNEVFTDEIYSITFPKRIRVAQFIRLEAGVYF